MSLAFVRRDIKAFDEQTDLLVQNLILEKDAVILTGKRH
jgi:hypothetical protein